MKTRVFVSCRQKKGCSPNKNPSWRHREVFLIENLGKGKAPLPWGGREETLQAREKLSLHEPVGMKLTPQPFPRLICSDIGNKR
jgi:hypothetical protein